MLKASGLVATPVKPSEADRASGECVRKGTAVEIDGEMICAGESNDASTKSSTTNRILIVFIAK